MTRTILYIEDNSDDLRLVQNAQSPIGCDSHGPATGQEGLDTAIECHPNLILLDVSLPDMDGHEIARKIRSDPRTAAIPVLALTAHTLIGDGERLLAAGCNAYLAKPINLLELRTRVQGFLNEPGK